MGFNCGIVGLPNVGKSTIFNALTAAGAAAENFPFCTIEPNVGVVPVPDARLTRLAQISGSEKIIATSLEVVDIAGLVAGASKGEGLGNKFLGHIRQVDAIAHVVRCFEDQNIAHVSGAVDPVADMDTIKTELLLADLEALDKRLDAARKGKKTGDKKAILLADKMEALREKLAAGIPARLALSADDAPLFRDLFLLTAKPVIYVLNVAEHEIGRQTPPVQAAQAAAQAERADAIVLCGKIESELVALDEEDRKAFLHDLGLAEPGLSQFIRGGYHLLDLITYFTTGPKETRAWTIRRGTKAPQAAGVIHSDFEKGFIRAEVIAYDDLDRLGSEQAAREAGLLRIEGRDYVFNDGDAAHFRFNL